MEKEELVLVVQALIFASPDPISDVEIFQALTKEVDELNIEEVRKAIIDVESKFSTEEFSFSLKKSGMGYSFVTKEKLHKYILKHIENIQRKRLSKSALETLAIIAFNQDCTKSEIEQIRGVSADYAVSKLLERELVEISGRKDTIGKPSTYRVTNKFLDYFGMQTLEELPSLDDIKKSLQQESIGE